MTARDETERILLSHGGGGRRAQELLAREFLPVFSDDTLAELGDSALVPGAERLAFTTDSFVVKPVFFPGGDIGRLAVCGTVNDLAMAGAVPRYISLAMILEEGLPFDALRRIVASIKQAADEANVRIVCGDTKVVERGAAESVFLTTSGIGIVAREVTLSPRQIRPGDAMLLSGTVGDHAIAVMSAREGIAFHTKVLSDVQPLNDLSQALLSAADVRCMRDPTRGGVAGVVNELAQRAGVSIELAEEAIPVNAGVRAACDILGLDPLYAANEGKLVAVVASDSAEAALAALKAHACGRAAAAIGRVGDGRPGRVTLRTRQGGRRIVDMPVGEQLPRIC
jgi:hydrogenase expression/formation protein HypE